MDELQEFWLLFLDVWHTGIFGVDLGRILAAVLIFVFFLFLRHVFSRIVVGRLKRMAHKTSSRIDDEAIDVLEQPLALLFVVIGVFFATEYLPLDGTVASLAEKTVRSLIVLVIFWGLVKLVDPLSLVVRRLESVITASLVEWLIKTVKIALIFVGAATVLEIWGIRVGPIIAGLGLFGLAVALGAQDFFKNLISGILILVEKRFNIGDWIKVDGVVEGTVEAINFRSTLVRQFDQAPVYVPNAKLSDNSVINYSLMTHRRIYWNISLEYRTTIAQLQRIRDEVEAFIRECGEFVTPPAAPLFVRYDQFNDSSINLIVYCFTRTRAWGEWLRIKEDLAYRIKQAVEKAGAGFAFPSRSLYIETLPGEQAEVFEPPAAQEDTGVSSCARAPVSPPE